MIKSVNSVDFDDTVTMKKLSGRFEELRKSSKVNKTSEPSKVRNFVASLVKRIKVIGCSGV